MNPSNDEKRKSTEGLLGETPNDDGDEYYEYKDKRHTSLWWIKRLAICAACVHFCFLVASVSLWATHANGSSTRYELSRSVFINSPALLNITETELAKSCPLTKFDLLSTRADFNVSGRGPVFGTWVNTRTKILNTFNVDGYGLLFAIYLVSCIAQVTVVYECYRAENSTKNTRYAYFEGPCSARWLEYAFTSPCQIVIISCCLLIRDVYTTTLLAVAQGALVQFGYALECAFELRVVETATEEEEPTNVKIPAMDFFKRDEQVKPLPILPWLQSTVNPQMSIQLWYWSFVPSALLHVSIWGILFSSLSEQINTRCREDEASMPKWIEAILVSQFLLFTCFVFVALIQALWLNVIPIPFTKRKAVTSMEVKDAFVQAFLWYTLFSLTAKVLLGGVYMGYVASFPFYTP
jgi:hypothetical protein